LRSALSATVATTTPRWRAGSANDVRLVIASPVRPGSAEVIRIYRDAPRPDTRSGLRQLTAAQFPSRR
jgi:hypothetical protein